MIVVIGKEGTLQYAEFERMGQFVANNFYRGRDDVLIVVGHGNRGNMQGANGMIFDGAELLNKLLHSRLGDLHRFSEIYLCSCYSAIRPECGDSLLDGFIDSLRRNGFGGIIVRANNGEVTVRADLSDICVMIEGTETSIDKGTIIKRAW